MMTLKALSGYLHAHCHHLRERSDSGGPHALRPIALTAIFHALTTCICEIVPSVYHTRSLRINLTADQLYLQANKLTCGAVG
jgi:hypothetical protein